MKRDILKLSALALSVLALTGEPCVAQVPPKVKAVFKNAKIDAADVEVEQKPAILYRPIPMRDGKTGRVISPNEKVTFPWGRTMTAKEFFEKLNAYEKKINALGYTVRNGPAGLPHFHLHVDKDKLRVQADKIRAIPESNAPKEKITRAKVIKKAPITLDKAGLRFGAAAPLSDKQAALQKIDEFNRKGYQVDQVDGLLVNPSEIATVSKAHALPSGVGYTNDSLPKLVNRGVWPLPQPQEQYTSIPFGHHKKWNWSLGFKYFGASYDGTFDVTGKAESTPDNSMANSLSEFHVSTQGEAHVSVLNDTYQVLSYGANYDTYDKTKEVDLVANFYVAGIKIFDKTYKTTDQFNMGDGFSEPFSVETPQLQFPVAWIFTLTGKVGASGSAGVNYNLALQSNGIYGDIQPFVTSSGFAEVGLGADLGVASASVGVGGNFTILNDNLTIGAKLGIGWLGKFYLRDEVYMSDELDALSGDIYLWGNVSAFGFTAFNGHICELANWQGVHYNGTWFDWNNSVPLNWN